MGNATLKVRTMQTKKDLSKRQTHIPVEFRTMMPNKYTVYERFKLREFEKAVISSCSVNTKNEE